MARRVVFRIWSPDSTEYHAYFFEVENPTPEKVRLANAMFEAKAEEYHALTGFRLQWRRVRLSDKEPRETSNADPGPELPQSPDADDGDGTWNGGDPDPLEGDDP